LPNCKVHIAQLSSPQLPLLLSHLAHSILLFCQIAKSLFTLWTFSNELQAAHPLKKFVGCSLHNFFSPPVCQNFRLPLNFFFPPMGCLLNSHVASIYGLRNLIGVSYSTTPLLFLKEYVKGNMAHY